MQRHPPDRRRAGPSSFTGGSGSDFPVFFATGVFFFKGILCQFESDLEYASRPQIGSQNARAWRAGRHGNRYDGLMKHILCGILLAASALRRDFFRRGRAR